MTPKKTDLPRSQGIARLAQEEMSEQQNRRVEQYITRLYADQVEWIKAKAEERAKRRGERPNAAEFLRDVIDAIREDWEAVQKSD